MKWIYDELLSLGLTPAGACGLMGNLYAESGLKFNVVERLCLKRLKENGKVYDDESYTSAVDSGKITRAEFLHPLPGKQYGYGIAQWTSEGRKAGLYDLAKRNGVSIADPDTQLDYLYTELRSSYRSVLDILTSTNSIREASDIVLTKFERPADQSERVKELRASYGQKYYDEYAKKEENMSVIIGSARSNENGGINGGKAGDQTGGEVSTQNWYLHSKGWIVLRPKTFELAEIIAETMQLICDNPNFGYCQDHRLSGFNALKAVDFNPFKVTTPVELDCSEAIRACVWAGGLKVSDFYTGNEADSLIETGKFDKLTSDEYCKSPNKLRRGDILVTKTKGHTVAVVKGNTGWEKDEKGWWYYRDGISHYLSTWAVIDHHWFYFDDNGYMLTGWHEFPEGWYYFNDSKNENEGQLWHEKAGGKGVLEPWYIE